MISDKELRDLAHETVEMARKAGADQADVLVEYSRVFTGRVRDGKTDLIKQATRRGLGLRAFVGGRTGFVSSSDLRPDSIAMLVDRAVALATIGEMDPHAGIPEASGASNAADSLDLFDSELAGLATDRKLKMARDAEAAARDHDKRVTQVDGTTFSDTLATITLANSAGRLDQYRATSANLFTLALCDDSGGKQRSGGYGTSRRFLKELESPEKVGTEAARAAVVMLGPVPISTRKVPILMHSDIAAAWLGAFSGAFNGEQIFKKASYLTEKMGQKIGSDLVSLVDDGVMKRGPATAPFDGDGLPTQRNVLLDAGVVKTFLYDAYIARKAGTRSTGNAQRGYDTTPGIGTRNLHILNGTSTIEEMLKAYPALFYMRDQGAFGYTPTTGDYSYQAAGLWIENGQVVHAVDGITVAGNTLQMLAGIVKVGNDLNIQGGTNSPHLLIDEMTISGEGTQAG
ncbi:MAG: TldD/PmbA family protein [Candidatus Eisenbacteria bacterium]|nr:TldD/PmbA family protein [Candidatus Eisenbacteria bacterium]